jgi:beta-mannosidase
VVAVNDARTPWTVRGVVARRSLTGAVLWSAPLTADVAPGSAVTVALPASVAATEILVADAGEHRAWWFPAEDKDIAWPPAAYDVEVSTTDGAVRVTVTARSFLRSLILYPDRLDPSAEVDDADVTLFPGESVTFTVTGAADLDADALARPPVLRCVNDIR